MPRLQIRLMGSFQVSLDGVRITGFESSKVRALLAYLAAEPERPHRRDSLAGLLWPDWPQGSALSNLRYALADLRKAIGDRETQPHYLLVQRGSLQLNPQANVWVDVNQFERVIRDRDQHEGSANLSTESINLKSGIELYRGPFLESFSVKDSPSFEEWILGRREFYNRQVLEALSHLTDWEIEQGDYAQAEGYARRQIELEAWREQAHRQLMRILSLKGERVQALAQFENLSKALRAELGVEPGKETVALYEQIRAEELVRQPQGYLGEGHSVKRTGAGRGVFNHFNSLLINNQPEQNFEYLWENLYSRTLSFQEQQNYLQIIKFARNLQAEDPTYEALFQHLLHLFVLNGSRLDLLKSMNRRLRGLVGGQGALILIGGVSGIGKTSLVMAFQERLTQLGVQLISGRCSGQEQDAFAVWQEVARSATSAGFSTDTLPAPLGRGKEVQSSHSLKRAMADWLQTCAASQPLVILLDDLHWADVDSLEMLDTLTQLPPTPILFLATYRSEEAHLKHALYDYLPRLQRNRMFDLFQLGVLTHADVERFVSAYLGAYTPELVAYLHERAEGHPLFTAGLLDDLIAQDLLTKDSEGCWSPPAQSVSVPGMLKQLITQRVSRLGAIVEQVLNIGAVAGESWSLKVVAPLADLPEDDLLEAVERALQGGLIKVEDERAEIYRFSHGLIREVVYTNQLVRRRRRFHQQIAAQLERQQPGNTFAIAHHYLEGEQWVKAVAACLAAGEQSIRQFAFYSALQWYQQALSAAERAEGTLTSEVLWMIYDHLGRTYQALEKPQEAEKVYERMRDIARSKRDLVPEGQALVNLAIARIKQYHFDLAEKTAYEALKISEQTGDAHLLAQTHTCLGALFLFRGPLEKCAYHTKEALSRLQMLDDPTLESEVFRYQGYLAIWAGQYRDEEINAKYILGHAQKSVDPILKVSGYQNLSWTQIEMGEYLEAYRNILAVVEAGDVSEAHHHNLPRLLNLMGYLHLELGDAQAALDWDRRALGACSLDLTQANFEMRRYSLLNIATDYLQLGNLEKVSETIAQFNAITEAFESVYYRYYNRYLLLLSEIALVNGEYSQATEWAQAARSLAETNGALKNIAKSHWFEGQALAGLRRYDQAVDQLEKGILIADEIQHGSLRWKIRLILAEVLRMAGRSPEKVIPQVREMVDRTIWSLSGSALQVIFLASGWLKRLGELEQDRMPETPAYPAGLTRREVEVLQLVARGATNQQVADVLHISVRTVNTHMTNILNKLGLDNRTAASAFAIQQNLV